MMRVLIAYESSGVVRRAFAERGHEVWSCDLEPADDGGAHIWGDAFHAIDQRGWDLIIAHPPCTALAVSGNRWYGYDKPKWSERVAAVCYVRDLANLMTCRTPRWVIENPVGVLSSHWRKPEQYIHPWQHGHGEQKKTGLWLHGVECLVPTDVVEGREQRVWKMGPSPERQKERSRTYAGIAKAMAEQWG